MPLILLCGTRMPLGGQELEIQLIMSITAYFLSCFLVFVLVLDTGYLVALTGLELAI